jgi:hypothetical protein
MTTLNEYLSRRRPACHALAAKAGHACPIPDPLRRPQTIMVRVERILSTGDA